MINFKITNITDTTGKRSIRFNSTLDIEYVDKMQKKTIQIKPGETIFLQINTLPLSVHKLRVRKLIHVVEVTDNELKNNMKINKSIYSPIIVEIPKETKIDTTERKKFVKKSQEYKPEYKSETKTESKTIES